MSEWKSSFHERINELFAREKDKDYKISVEAYAEKLGITRPTLRGWLAGNGEPKTEKLKEVAEKAGVSVYWLMGIDNDPTPPINSGGKYSLDNLLARFDEEGQKMLLDYLEFLESRKNSR